MHSRHNMALVAYFQLSQIQVPWNQAIPTSWGHLNSKLNTELMLHKTATH